MKIENQVCTLDQAEKLFHLGVAYEKPQYVFVERLRQMKLCNVLEFNRWAYQYNEPSVESRTYYPAFTVAELGIMLNGYESRVERQNSGMYLILERGLANAFFYATKTEAEGRATLLIFLIEHHLFQLQEVNRRLQIA